MELCATRDRLIMDAAAAAEVAATLAAQTFDLLLLLQASFADSTMAVELARIAAAQQLPVLLWALPEVRDGGRLRLNSLCGINLAGHAFSLNKLHFDFLLEEPESDVAIRNIEMWAGNSTNRTPRFPNSQVGSANGRF